MAGKSTLGRPHVMRRSLGFKVLAWAMLAYVALAALHGLAPGIWSHSGAEENHGPFRMFIFTPLLLACLALLVVAVFVLHAVRPLHEAEPSRCAAWPSWSLRGPPSPLPPSRSL